MLKSGRLRFTIVVAGSFLAAYAVVCASSIKAQIGRQHPGIASLLSPPMFNFHGEYSDGKVLKFEIGMNRQEFCRALMTNYSGQAEVMRDCQIVNAKSLVLIEPGTDISSLVEGNAVCIRWRGNSMIATIGFSGELVRNVEIVFARISL